MEASRKAWELENTVQVVDHQRDALYDYDDGGQIAINAERPWRKDPHFFQNARISANALLKMVMHARSGGSLEIMGLMQGKVIGNTFIVTDAFRLPVEGTETRVNAGAEADEYQVNYLQSCRDNGRPDNAIGWYHSHPGYGCWLSGIDVSTQMLQQSFQDPYLAVVIDPDRTISAGKVEIGAFRTFPEDYRPQPTESDGYQSIPLSKTEDFGAHASRYYSLEVSHFKSTLDSHLLDLLWNKYWVTTLSQSPLSTNRQYGSRQMLDLSEKLQNAEKTLQMNLRNMQQRITSGGNGTVLEKVIKDGDKVAREETNGLLANEAKVTLFNDVGALDCA